MSVLTSYNDCKHRRWIFVQSEHHQEEKHSGSTEVTVCEDCGSFHVWGWRDGQHFDVRFVLPTNEQVIAAGRYVAYLASRENKVTA